MTPDEGRMPVVFLGHGSPMNAIVPNRFADAWAKLGRRLPRPRAVLAVSAHWYVAGIGVTAMDRPRTIHDFGGFPEPLFEVQYPAPGSPELARRVATVLGGPRDPVGGRAPLGGEVVLDTSWGLDHGTWSVLRHVYPDADVPVVQLSIDGRRPAADHLALGRALSTLRDEGVLVLGSGNVVHNLSLVRFDDGAPPFDWAQRFEGRVRELVLRGDGESLADTDALGPDFRLAAPTPEHYLPLLYVLGAAAPGEPVSFPVEGIEGSSLSMLSVVVGLAD